MKKYLFGAAIAALAIPVAASAQRAPAAAIIVVDGNRLFNECSACRGAQVTLQGMITQAQTRQQQLAQTIQAEAQSIQTAGTASQAMAAGPARTAAENAVRSRLQTLQGRQDAANQELQRLDQNIQSTRANVQRQLNERLRPIYDQVRDAHGANLVLDIDATLSHSPTLDVTNEVLAALNAALPSVSVTPMPQQAPPPGQPQGR